MRDDLPVMSICVTTSSTEALRGTENASILSTVFRSSPYTRAASRLLMLRVVGRLPWLGGWACSVYGDLAAAHCAPKVGWCHG
jgi:hypothetical protein